MRILLTLGLVNFGDFLRMFYYGGGVGGLASIEGYDICFTSSCSFVTHRRKGLWICRAFNNKHIISKSALTHKYEKYRYCFHFSFNYCVHLLSNISNY